METCFVSSLPSDVMRFAYSVTGIGLDLQAEHIKPLNWLKAGVAYTTDIGVPYFEYLSADKGGGRRLLPLGSAPGVAVLLHLQHANDAKDALRKSYTRCPEKPKHCNNNCKPQLS